jgi:hypothetical protein
MKRLLALLACLLISGPAHADDNLPQFPKVAAPDPLPDASCQNVASPLTWGLGDWASASLKLHLDKNGWILSGEVDASGTETQIDPCSFNLTANQDTVFKGVRAADGRLYGALWTPKGKVLRLILKRL